MTGTDNEPASYRQSRRPRDPQPEPLAVVSAREQARAVLLRAMSGSFPIEEFHDSWPHSQDPLIRTVFDDTEDTVEHVPGSWLRRRPDYDRFRKSVDYKTLIVDAELLADEFAGISSDRLVEIRDQLLKEIDLRQDDATLANSVREFVARQTAGVST